MTTPPGLYTASASSFPPSTDIVREPLVNWRICLLCYAVLLVLGPGGGMLLHILHLVPPANLTQAELPQFVIAATLVAPVLETFLFFYLPYHVLKKLISSPRIVWGLSFLTTAFLFVIWHHGGSHLYRNWLMASHVGLTGTLCFMGCFYLTTQSDRGSPFWSTALCHLFYNSTLAFVIYLSFWLGN
ncbi:CPBP family glutamic-type intramembrane protease [Acetobacter tropicalis]|uniref:CAAX prenyl protease 2/Lysostaphin resistance protein A-like domain-containing protein n=1 Tax=Acetobacter tropicalis TaxID=104102 RepID=A0A511FRS5_9PROT|nr:CPBP family glutamic-type intramembrane protease [Acetobacter tropicalis]KXV48718.1 hypothetical protein AD944_09560 [Acetobacter tropicalis]GEL51604.1 hypothetical protein ATR01nite_26790 [Acetobacter tropicalis]